MAGIAKEQFIQIMQSVSKRATGTGFVLLMEHETTKRVSSYGNKVYKDYSIHPRFSQPCQGGELRKYESSHPGRCTQPHNERPGDLYQPFPDGKPAAVAFHLKGSPDEDEGDYDDEDNYIAPTGSSANERDNLVMAVLSSTSPWISGFGGNGVDPVSNIKYTTDKQGHIIGFVIKSLSVDPTVMVNMVNFIQTMKGTGAKSFKKLVDLGLTINEALAVLMLNGSSGSIGSIQPTYEYRFPAVFSARRFFEARPNDYSGGTYENGADYNRTFVQDVFSGDTKKGGIVWATAMKAKMGAGGFTVEKLAAAAKELFKECLANEPAIETTPYVYKNASGKVLPHPEYAIKVNPSLGAPITNVVLPQKVA
jgi:hypothetical protein